MKREKIRRCTIILLMITLLSLTYGIKYLNKSKYEELPEVKLKKKIEKNKSFAIMVQNENGNDYVKYTEDKWPSSGYKFKEAKCTDNNGNMVENAITFADGKATLTTNQTIYCTLYFDVLFNGKGTKDNPYKINFIEDLVDLQVAVNNGETYKGKYFTLEKNLDFNIESDYQNYQSKEYGDINGVSGIEGIKEELTNQDGRGFIPIGTYTKPFSGNIDGKNNKISNLWIYNTKDENQTIGFVGNLINGSISNLTITGEVKTTGATPLGGLVNRIENGTIDNCINEVNVTSNNKSHAVGGLVGWSSGDASITNSTNRGNVTNGGYTGGIIAGNQGGTLTLENCKNYGKIENNLGISGIGGILGSTTFGNAKKTIIKNSVNYGEIKVNNKENVSIYAGGIMGRNTKELEIVNSHNEGVININGTTSINVGGMVGISTDKTSITNCYNLGEINSSTSGNNVNIVGGLAGHIDYSDIATISKIENSYNKGNINGGNRTGGILGAAGRSSKIIINKCYNSGNIITQEDTNYQYSASVGGLVCGSTDESKAYILNSYNAGILRSNPTKTSGYASGIILEINSIGSNGSSAIIINSYNLGNMNAKSFLASFGQTFTDNDYLLLNNVYNVGNLDGGVKNTVLNTHNSNSPFNVKNTYYKEVNEIQESDKGDIPEAYPITDANMKNANTQDNNSLIYKLNQNVVNINKSGLSLLDKDIIGTDLDGYTLVDWVIDPITGYPTLNYNLESN